MSDSEISEPRLMSSEAIYSGKVVELTVERIQMPSGATTDLEIIHHPGATAIVPITEDGRVLMVRQYRYATEGWLLEVPAGKLDPGEEPRTCATRETEEEIGMRPSQLIELGWIWTTPGFTDEKIWLYLARGLEPTQQRLQTDELLSVVPITFEDAIERVHSGEICDSKSVCALLRAEAVLSSAGETGVE